MFYYISTKNSFISAYFEKFDFLILSYLYNLEIQIIYNILKIDLVQLFKNMFIHI